MVEYFKQKSSGFKPRPAIDPGAPTTLHRGADGSYRPALPARSKLPNTGEYRGRWNTFHGPLQPPPGTAGRPLAPNPQPGRSAHSYNRSYDGYGGAKDSISGKLPKYRGFAAGAFGFLMDNADDLQNWDWSRFWEKGDLPWGLPSDEIIRRLNEANGIIVPGGDDDTRDKLKLGTKDGWDTWVSFGKGYNQCANNPARYPGTVIPDPSPYLFAQEHFFTGHNDWDQSNCQTWPLSPQRSTGFHPVARYQSVYSRPFWYQNNQYYYDAAPYFGVTLPSGVDPADAVDIIPVKVPEGVVPTNEQLGIKSSPAMYMPGETTFGHPENPNSHAPKDWRGAMKAARLLTGTRYDSGYNPDVDYPTTPGTSVTITVPGSPNPGGGGAIEPPKHGTTSPEPWHQGKRQEKYRIRGMGAFRLVQEVFHGLGEAGDLVDAFYDALPKKRQTCDKATVGGPTCKAWAIGKYWNEVDKTEAIVNAIVNHFEDKVIGKAMKARDAAAGRLGTKDWKIFNEVPGHVDDPMFQAYGEIAKNIVSPTKEGITSAVKQYLGIN